jgi:hypothetical protein
MTRLVCLPVALIAAITCQLVLAQAPQGISSATTGTAKPRQLTIHNKEWTGDFNKMLERRMIRVYAPSLAPSISTTTDASVESQLS